MPLRLVYALALSLSTFCATAALPDAQQLRYALDANGAPRIVQSLIQRGEQKALLERISQGDDMWIALAPALGHSGKPTFNTQLYRALRQALLINPAAVLQAVQHSKDALPLKAVCHADSADAAAQQRRQRVVKEIRVPALQSLKTDCLAALSG